MNQQRVQYRPRSVLLSSSNIGWYTSSETVTVYLGEPVSSEDGFDLAYGIRSLGFHNTSMNISHRLKNNSLTIRVYYDNSNVQYKLTPIDPSNHDLGYRYRTPLTTAEKENLPNYIDHEVSIPDGHYTFTELLSELKNLLGVPSGLYVNVTNSHLDTENIIHLSFQFTETVSGFTMTAYTFYPAPTLVNYTWLPTGITDPPAEVLPINQICPLPVGYAILPSDESSLFNLLFTNRNTDYPDVPISSPPWKRATGLNPPNGIYFGLFIIDDIVNPPGADLLTPTKTVAQPVIADGHIKELGNENIYDTKAGIYPDKIWDHEVYKAYYKARLDPVYLEIEISLPNPSIDERGHGNTLSRLFTLGTDVGNSSLSQYWDTPKMVVLDGFTQFSSIQLNFKAEDDKWDFFNLEFTIELYVCEYLIEDNEDTNVRDVTMPPSDVITDTSINVGGSSIRPLPASHFPYRNSAIHNVHKRRRR